MTWIILKTLPPQFSRCFEFAVRAELIADGYDAIVPERMRYRTNAKGAKVPRISPLIPGYVFAKVPPDAISYAKRIHGVRGVVEFGGNYGTLTSSEVRALRIMGEREDAGPTQSRFKAGQRIRMRRGAWAELQGLIVRLGGGKARVEVELFGGRKFEASVDEGALEAV
jgi:transcription antitermination factor NusG